MPHPTIASLMGIMMINRWIAGHPIAQQVAVVLGDDGSTSA